MEDQTKKIRIWLLILAFFAGFSTPSLFSQDLVNVKAIPTSRGIAPVILTFNCINGQPGDTICLPVTVENFTDIVIAQFEIIWNSNVLDYIKVQNPGSPSINVNSDFNLSGPNALKFIPLGFPINGESLPDGTVLFEICFRIIGTPGSMSSIGISPYFPFEVADINGVVPSDSVGCSMTVDNAMNLVGFVTSCGPDMVGNNGTIDVTIYGGTAPYNITWDDHINPVGGPVPVFTEGGNTMINVPAGNYDVTITDALGNTVTYSAEVDILGLSVITRIKQPTCYKFSNGIIWIKPKGGSAPFSYIWESLSDPLLAGSGFIRFAGDSSQVTSLKDGIYSITVEDDNGCEVIVLDTLLDNPFVFTINNFQNASCNGSADGFIDLTISGARPDVSGNYLVKGPTFTIQTNAITIGLLNPGDYCITVSDQVSQCDTVYCFTIGFSDTLSATVTLTDPPCHGGLDGKVSLRGRTNGIPMPPYDYFIYDENDMLKNSQLNVGGIYTYSGLGAGNYYGIVMSPNGCLSDSIFFTINDPPAIMVSLVGTNPDNCIPLASGDAWFSISNGVPPYTLNAGAGFQDADTLFNMNSGNYMLTVTDANGCTAKLPFHIPAGDENEEADISFQIDGTPCDGGQLIVLYQGLPIPANVGVLWSNGETNDTITITSTDTLSVDVILGAPIFCILNDTVHIDCQVKLNLNITVMQPLCGEGAAGGPYTATVIADTSNAVAPVTWYWSFPDTTTTGIYTGIAPGKYYVTVTDALDSMAIDSFEVIAPNPLHLTFSNIDSTSCPDACDGAAQVVATNGDANLDYFLYWDPVNPKADTGLIFNVNNLCAGLTVFNVSQDGICFYKDTVEIFAPDSLDITLVNANDANCNGSQDGSIQVAASGGTPGYTYSWIGGPTNATYPGIGAGTYHVIVTDNKNCMVEDSFSISQPDTLIADIDLAGTIQVSCGNTNDGVITLNVSGGNPGGYSYVWTPNVSTTYQAANLSAGNYQITVSDPKGCSDTASYTLVAPLPVVATWPVVDPPMCFGDESSFQLTTVTGGSGNYSYNINGGEQFDIGETVSLPSGIYIIVVSDDRGCSDDTTYMIVEPNPILVSIGPDDPVINLGDSLYITGSVDQSDLPINNTLWTSEEPVSCPTCAGTWVFNSLPTLYTWTVTDINGCTGSASILVNVDFDRHVYIPNVFSPNNDGRNDDFKIYTGLGVTAINYFRIYDRWGNLVHEEKGLLPSDTGAGKWDGTFNGDPLNPGVYVFVAEISFIDNATLTYSGDITLVK
jgi:gliding motility-associated-like protein